VPEGDTILHLARRLTEALAGRTVTRFESPLALLSRAHLEGHAVTAVDARGKNLLVRFDDGRVLHTHLHMHGAWHVYAPGERWRRPAWHARAVLEVDGGTTAVCFGAPVVRLLRGERGDPMLARLGPDILAGDFDAALARRRLRALGEAVAIGDALLDQRALAGIGNVFKSEVLFVCRVDPFAPLAALDDPTLDAVISEAHRLMHANVDGAAPRRTRGREGRPGSRLWVYDRSGRPCFVCGGLVAMRRQARGRSTYFCPECQRTVRSA
jgi:endonuclease-8